MEPGESGLVPASEGWFVVNVRDAAWLTNEHFGAVCGFEADMPVVRGVVRAAAADDNTLRALVQAIVASDSFQKRMKTGDAPVPNAVYN